MLFLHVLHLTDNAGRPVQLIWDSKPTIYPHFLLVLNDPSCRLTGFAQITGTVPVTGWEILGTESTSSSLTRVWTKQATPDDAGGTISVELSTYTKGALTVAAYRGTGDSLPSWTSAAETTRTDTHMAPTIDAIAGSTMVSYWGEKSSATSMWTPPDGQAARSQTIGSGGGHVDSLLTDGRSPATGRAGGLGASTDDPSRQATMWTILLAGNT